MFLLFSEYNLTILVLRYFYYYYYYYYFYFYTTAVGYGLFLIYFLNKNACTGQWYFITKIKYVSTHKFL